MDTFEKIGYTLLGVLALLWLMAMLTGMVIAFPFDLVGLVALVGIGALFMKVCKERLVNKEDDYYSKNVER
jgi:hypothetical protein